MATTLSPPFLEISFSHAELYCFKFNYVRSLRRSELREASLVLDDYPRRRLKTPGFPVRYDRRGCVGTRCPPTSQPKAQVPSSDLTASCCSAFSVSVPRPLNSSYSAESLSDVCTDRWCLIPCSRDEHAEVIKAR